MAGGKSRSAKKVSKKMVSKGVKSSRKHSKSIFKGGSGKKAADNLGVYFNGPNKIGLPKLARLKLKYADLSQLTLASAAYQFRLNSLYDPDYSSTGHQPNLYDTFCQNGTTAIGPYSTYRVNAVKCKYTLRYTGASAIYFALQVYSNYSTGLGTSTANLNAMIEDTKNCVVKRVGPLGSGQSDVTITKTVNIAEMLSLDPKDDTTLCSATSNPQLTVWAELTLWDVSGVIMATRYNFETEMIFDVSFGQPNNLTVN